MSMRDEIADIVELETGRTRAGALIVADAIMELLAKENEAFVFALEAELAAIEFALDGQDPSEHADLKLARLKGSRIRAALKGSDT